MLAGDDGFHSSQTDAAQFAKDAAEKALSKLRIAEVDVAAKKAGADAAAHKARHTSKVARHASAAAQALHQAVSHKQTARVRDLRCYSAAGALQARGGCAQSLLCVCCMQANI